MKMEIDLDDEKVLEYFNKWQYIPWDRVKQEYKDYLLNRFNDMNIYENEKDTLKECITRLRNNIEEIPKCPICGKPRKSYMYWYGASCGNIECSTKIQQRTYIKTLHTLYGEHINNTSQLEYVKEKQKKTCLERYGTTSPLSNKEIWNKTRQHTIEKYGAAYNKEKFNNTMMKKYGVKWFTLSDKLKKNAASKEAKEKCFETQKKNGTINTSKSEEMSFDLLKEKFNDIKRNYKCERYPFACDFYIPSLDLFIECQYSMFHNHRPYTGNEADIKDIEKYETRSKEIKEETGRKKTRYDSIIETWTIRDVTKRNIAKENNLNYLEFFTILELEDWLNKYDKCNE